MAEWEQYKIRRQNQKILESDKEAFIKGYFFKCLMEDGTVQYKKEEPKKNLKTSLDLRNLFKEVQ